MKNPLTRFSKTVDNYVRYRPDYPQEITTFLSQTIGLNQDSVVADIGSGTGKSTLPFLKNKNIVYAVEPNAPMRAAAEKLLKSYPNFKSINGSAEETTLVDNSVNMILAGQAFHWFDIVATRKEFLRIGQQSTNLVLLWNKRDDVASDFMHSYNDFLNTFATDYTKVNLRYINEADYELIFGHTNWKTKTFPNQQIFDWEGLKGRYLSCSYAYDKTHSEYEKAMQRLFEIFEKHNIKGQVEMKYKTELHYGKLNYLE